MTSERQSTLQHNRAVFERLLDRAEGLQARGRSVAAASACQLASDFAWNNHSGIFSSPRLESIVSSIGLGMDPAPADSDRPEAIDSVLHVLTEAYRTGGHTRLAWRWAEQDTKRVHSVAFTRPTSDKPPALVNAVAARGGNAYPLHGDGDRLLGKARELRSLSESFDAVVLHIHPFDVVPGLAFAGRRQRARVAHLDHADHVFWTGTTSADVFVHLRNSGHVLGDRRRSLNAASTTILPIPLDPTPRRHARTDAKARLDLDPASVLLVTIAAPYKFENADPSILDLVLPVLERHGEAVMIAVGPQPSGAWTSAAVSSGGRVRALGLQTDISLYLEAADVCLDSFPFCSNTSLLDAGLYDTPGLSFTPDRRGALVLSPDAPGLDDELIRASTPERYREELELLIREPAVRTSRGQALGSRIRALHVGSGWLERCENVYSTLLTTERGERSGNGPSVAEPERFDEDVLALSQTWGSSLPTLLHQQLLSLDYSPRPRDGSGAIGLGAS